MSNDSCDEFPFAKTYQSGNMLSQTWTQCTQVTPRRVNGAWVDTSTSITANSPQQRCGIGHVPLLDNKSVGGLYGAFVKNNRILDKDPFWLLVQP